MAKNSNGNPIQKDPGAKPARKPRFDLVRLATLGGVVALLALSFMMWRSIAKIENRVDTSLARIENRLSQVSGKVDTAMARSNQPQQRGPDPNRVYTINTAGAPAIGPATAPVTIAEFSDFQ